VDWTCSAALCWRPEARPDRPALLRRAVGLRRAPAWTELVVEDIIALTRTWRVRFRRGRSGWPCQDAGLAPAAQRGCCGPEGVPAWRTFPAAPERARPGARAAGLGRPPIRFHFPTLSLSCALVACASAAKPANHATPPVACANLRACPHPVLEQPSDGDPTPAR
jgi:hypothetical protein